MKIEIALSELRETIEEAMDKVSGLLSENIYESDACTRCKHFDLEIDEYPCNSCMYGVPSRYEPDEPEHEKEGA